MVNVERLDNAMAHIVAHPEEWNQGYWAARVGPSCNTAYCLGGTVAAQAGAAMEWDTSRFGDAAHYCIDPEGNRQKIDAYAQQLLELSNGDADILFDGINSLENLQRMVELLKLGESLDGYFDRDDDDYDDDAY